MDFRERGSFELVATYTFDLPTFPYTLFPIHTIKTSPVLFM